MNEKFQPGDMVKATQGAGKFFKSGDVGRVIRHHTDGTVKVDWSVGNNPKGHYGDGEWWAKESELVRLAEPSTAKLTLPIVVGKKYVRRDGEVITARASTDQCHEWGAIVDDGAFSAHNTVYKETGRVFGPTENDRYDLVSDYIEPAKGHPHAALMMEFAKDAAESETPWERWEVSPPSGCGWCNLHHLPGWHETQRYRRKPTVTPDPHAENAAEYAKDMALSDKAWERWEWRMANSAYSWNQMQGHPSWEPKLEYQRRPV